jgi:uncharacterized protein (UPF0548 family)
MRHAAVAKALRALVCRAPFKPYVIELHNGRSIVVAHPEAVILAGEAGRTVVCREANRVFHILDSTSICELHDLPPSPPSI